MTDPNTLRQPPAGREPPRLLVVDPDRNYLLVLGRRLGQQGYRIVAAQCASAAIAELTRAPIDLLLADLHLPRLAGIELARLVRGEARWQDLPVMLIAGRSDPGGVVDGLAAGADDVVVKPFEFDVLLARIERQLGRARALGELRRDNAMLDARIVRRAIELGEARSQLVASEAERRRLMALVGRRTGESAD